MKMKPRNRNALIKHARQAFPGRNGDHISAKGSGAQFVRITAKMGMPGTTSLMTRHDRGLIGGEKTVSPA
jgi:hypothetical protein